MKHLRIAVPFLIVALVIAVDIALVEWQHMGGDLDRAQALLIITACIVAAADWIWRRLERKDKGDNDG